MIPRPENVGILAIELYVPPSYVSQADLEVHDAVSTGKYTIGLGQDRLSFCCDQEDVISMSLTVVQRLLEKHEINPARIGRLEVGTETVIDKSKSIKSALMTLFEKSGNSDIEGADSSNACYGGTAALLNGLNWLESSGWDGRFALVVATDSAVYAEGPARPTGGAGAVAMLLGPNSPLALEHGLTSTHSENVYDFYKPKLASEYPVVDGKLSQTCYIHALDMCYRTLCRKFEKLYGSSFSLDQAGALVFHAPYNKLVQKSVARLIFDDFQHLETIPYLSDEEKESLRPFLHLPEEQSLTDRDLEKAAVKASKSLYKAKVDASAYVGQQVGNMYTASVYAGLASLLAKKGPLLEGQRVLVFSYGSGLISSMFSLRVSHGAEPFSLPRLSEAIGVSSLLENRVKVSPEEFVKTMHLMESRYGACDYVPKFSADHLQDGVFYLSKVDDLYRRTYERKGVSHVNGVS